MREIYLEVKITNYEDIGKQASGFIKQEEIRSVKLSGKVDTGSTCLVIPRKVYEELGLREIDNTPVTYAGGKQGKRPMGSVVKVEINGRRTVTEPIIEEEGGVLIGNPIIEAMDYNIDTVTGELLPRHPEFPGPVEEIM